MKSIPNLEMPPASSPVSKGDAAGDKLELSGENQPTEGLLDMFTLTVLNSESGYHRSFCGTRGPYLTF
jgi:hypothetical protein